MRKNRSFTIKASPPDSVAEGPIPNSEPVSRVRSRSGGHVNPFSTLRLNSMDMECVLILFVTHFEDIWVHR